jgi:biotin carboxylase
LNKKKLLILGGSDIQVTVIKKAKQMGYYTITCDYLPNNPGHQFADEYHNVSTTEIDKVLDLAKKLKINGILAYASDPAAPTAAYVAENMGLPTNPFSVVKMMSRKDLFREFMIKNGFEAPKSGSFSNIKEAKKFVNELNEKAIIKPVDSSGSKGIYVINSIKDFEVYFEKSMSYSIAGLVIIEEFIEKKGYQIGGDGFILNGELIFRCFGDIHFSKTNPLLPCSVSVPTLHKDHIVKKVHNCVQNLFTNIGMKMGAVNFDVLVTKDDRVFILEIGARNGGNMIPELTKYCTGVDMIEYSIKMALGEDCSDLKMKYENKYFSHYVLHSQKTGVLKDIKKDKLLKDHILFEQLNFSKGDQINKFNSSADRLGIILLKYKNKEQMLDIIYNMNKFYEITVTS